MRDTKKITEIIKPSYKPDGNPTRYTFAGHEAAHAAIRHYYGIDADEIGLTKNQYGEVESGYCSCFNVADDLRIEAEAIAGGLAWEWQGREDIREAYSMEMENMEAEGFIFHGDGSTTLPDGRQVLLNMQVIEADGTIGDIDRSIYLTDCDHLRRNFIKRYEEPSNKKQEEFFWRRLETTFKEAWDILDMFYETAITRIIHELIEHEKLSGEQLNELFISNTDPTEIEYVSLW